jgi:hypothetical protein
MDLLFIPALIFLLISSCATKPPQEYDYIVSKYDGEYLCDDLEHGAYGAAALRCVHVNCPEDNTCEPHTDNGRVYAIVNPSNVVKIKENGWVF